MSWLRRPNFRNVGSVRGGVAAVAGLGLMLACLGPIPAGVATSESTPDRLDGFTAAASEAQLELEDSFLSTLDPSNVADSTTWLGKYPGEDGTKGALRRVRYIKQKLESYGLDVEVQKFYPYMANPQKVKVAVDMVKPEQRSLPVKEKKQPWHKKFDTISVGYNEGSPSADITKKVVYVNFGRDVDYKYLRSQGISVRNKIVLVRYGGSQRSEVPYQAYAHGAAGVIFYSDPQQDGYVNGEVYPEGPWRAPDGIQRGTVYRWTLYPGDPLTPGRAATKNAPRIPVSKSNISQIPPTTPIGYGAAKPLLKNLGGPLAPKSWQGGLPFKYRIGPGSTKVHLKIDINYKPRPSYNIIAKIRGTESPEKVTVAGTHYDTWAYGAYDNVSGVAAQLEVARGLGKLMANGWQPKRSIALGFWSAEERGITGSTEWTELLGTEKMAHVVGYINSDVVSGPNFHASGVPAMDDLVYDTAKRVDWPGTDGSLYDDWAQRGDGDTPSIARPGGGTDYMTFLNHFGTPIVSLGSRAPGGRYHCTCDDVRSLKKFMDPGFRYTTAVGKEIGLLALRLTQADVLPFDYSTYASEVVQYLHDFDGAQKMKFGQAQIDLTRSIEAAEEWADAARDLEQTRDERLNRGADDYREMNDALQDVERMLLTEHGLPGRPWFKHQIYAAQFHNGFALQKLPGLYDALMTNQNRDQARRYERRLRESLREATEVTRQATE